MHTVYASIPQSVGGHLRCTPSPAASRTPTDWSSRTTVALNRRGSSNGTLCADFSNQNQPLDRRAQGCEISSCQFSIRVPIVSAEKEQDWHTGAGNRASQAQAEEFLIHRLKR